MSNKAVYVALGSVALLLVAAGGAQAAGPTAQGTAQVNVVIEPIASLTFTTPPLLSLEVPPSTSTVNTSGTVDFVVTGNAAATLTAAPDQFVLIPGANNGYMGKAVLNGGAVGYQIQLAFPSNSVSGSGQTVATLPLYVAGSTQPAPAVPLPLTGGQRPGTIDLLASAAWTPDRGLPLPGVYTGQVILTLTASNL